MTCYLTKQTDPPATLYLIRSNNITNTLRLINNLQRECDLNNIKVLSDQLPEVHPVFPKLPLRSHLIRSHPQGLHMAAKARLKEAQCSRPCCPFPWVASPASFTLASLQCELIFSRKSASLVTGSVPFPLTPSPTALSMCFSIITYNTPWAYFLLHVSFPEKHLPSMQGHREQDSVINHLWISNHKTYQGVIYWVRWCNTSTLDIRRISAWPQNCCKFLH